MCCVSVRSRWDCVRPRPFIRPGAPRPRSRPRPCAMNEPVPVLRARGIVRRFNEGQGQLEVLSGLDLEVATAQRLAIIGASGSGKTTLLQILGGLDKPNAGQIEIAGRDINALDERARGE